MDILPGRSSVATVPEYWLAARVEYLNAFVMPGIVSREGAVRWLPVADYEAILASLVAENASRAVQWEPDTPEQAADRAEITEALFDEQAAIMTRGDDD